MAPAVRDLQESNLMRGNRMKSIRYSVLFMLFSLPFCSVVAQEKAERETDIHDNVKLLEMPVPPNIPEEFRAKYQLFLGRLKQALKDKTSERSSASALVIQVCPGIREVGTSKTKQPAARITAFKKDSKSEYVANVLLYSYATGETVNKEEIERLLALQILNPLDLN